MVDKPVRKGLKLEIHPTVFWTSAGLIVLFVVFSLFNLKQESAVFKEVQAAITSSAGWFFVAAVNVYLGMVIYLLFSRHGDIRIGGSDARPEFST
jgi:choline/glycine/proline betaine transport protein